MAGGRQIGATGRKIGATGQIISNGDPCCCGDACYQRWTAHWNCNGTWTGPTADVKTCLGSPPATGWVKITEDDTGCTYEKFVSMSHDCTEDSDCTDLSDTTPPSLPASHADCSLTRWLPVHRCYDGAIVPGFYAAMGTDAAPVTLPVSPFIFFDNAVVPGVLPAGFACQNCYYLDNADTIIHCTPADLVDGGGGVGDGTVTCYQWDFVGNLNHCYEAFSATCVFAGVTANTCLDRGLLGGWYAVDSITVPDGTACIGRHPIFDENGSHFFGTGPGAWTITVEPATDGTCTSTSGVPETWPTVVIEIVISAMTTTTITASVLAWYYGADGFVRIAAFSHASAIFPITFNADGTATFSVSSELLTTDNFACYGGSVEITLSCLGC